MAARRLTAEQLQETRDLVSRYGGVSKAAAATGTSRATLQARFNEARHRKAEPIQVAVEAPREQVQERERKTSAPRAPLPPKPTPRRHFFIPDCQVRPGVPLDHIDWVAQALVDYKPDVIIEGGDFWDLPSLNQHEKPGSVALEGARFEADIAVGNEAFTRLCKPMEAEIAATDWRPELEALEGNHEERADRAAAADPKWMGTVGSHHCNVRSFRWHSFLKRLWIDGVLYSHYFQSTHSKFAIGGSIDNRLNKIGASFVQGHEQGFRYGTRITGAGPTWHGVVAGSCYLHVENYRGAQGQGHWRGVIVLNEVSEGDFCIMPLTLSYLCRKYEGVELLDFMNKKYPDGDWNHLR